jgi:hypothetical protein
MRDVQSKFRRTLMVPSLALGQACLGVASMVYYHFRLFIPRAAAVQKAEGLAGGYSFGNDLYQIWITTRSGYSTPVLTAVRPLQVRKGTLFLAFGSLTSPRASPDVHILVRL